MPDSSVATAPAQQAPAIDPNVMAILAQLIQPQSGQGMQSSQSSGDQSSQQPPGAYQQGAQKALKEAGYAHANQALQAGMAPDQIQSHSLMLPTGNAPSTSTGQPNPSVLAPTNPFQGPSYDANTGNVQEGGFINRGLKGLATGGIPGLLSGLVGPSLGEQMGAVKQAQILQAKQPSEIALPQAQAQNQLASAIQSKSLAQQIQQIIAAGSPNDIALPLSSAQNNQSLTAAQNQLIAAGQPEHIAEPLARAKLALAQSVLPQAQAQEAMASAGLQRAQSVLPGAEAQNQRAEAGLKRTQFWLAGAQTQNELASAGLQRAQSVVPGAQAANIRAQIEMQNLQNSGNEPIQPKDYMSAYSGMYQKALDSYGKVSDSVKDIANTSQELFDKTSDTTRAAWQKFLGMPSRESSGTFQSAVAAQKAALDATADFHDFLFKNNPGKIMNQIQKKVSGNDSTDDDNNIEVGDKFNGETVTNVQRIN